MEAYDDMIRRKCGIFSHHERARLGGQFAPKSKKELMKGLKFLSEHTDPEFVKMARELVKKDVVGGYQQLSLRLKEHQVLKLNPFDIEEVTGIDKRFTEREGEVIEDVIPALRTDVEVEERVTEKTEDDTERRDEVRRRFPRFSETFSMDRRDVDDFDREVREGLEEERRRDEEEDRDEDRDEELEGFDKERARARQQERMDEEREEEEVEVEVEEPERSRYNDPELDELARLNDERIRDFRASMRASDVDMPFTRRRGEIEEEDRDREQFRSFFGTQDTLEDVFKSN